MKRRAAPASPSRRAWLQGTLSGIGGLALAGCAPTTGSGGRRPDHSGTSDDTGGFGDSGLLDDTGSTGPVLADTGPALEDRVPASLTRQLSGELDLDLVLLSGALPEDWGGHVWLVHASPYDDGGPVFMGDGQLLRFDLDGSGVRATRRTLRTPCQLADEALVGTEHAFENSGMARMSMGCGVRNFANTCVVPLGDRILVTFDAGRPWEIDPQSLEIATAVGWNSEWRSALPEWIGWFTAWPFPLLMSTAHPAVDPESGQLFSVAYGLELLGIGAFTELVRWDGRGGLETWELVDEDGRAVSIAQSVHQLAVTRNHVVLADTAFLVEVDLLIEGEAEAQAADSVLWIVDRADLHAGNSRVSARRMVVARELVHFLADFDDSEGIVLHVAHNPAADPSEFLEQGDLRADTGTSVRSDLWGLPAAPTDMGAFGRYVIDAGSATVIASEIVYDDRLWGGPALAATAGPAMPTRHDAHWWCSAGFHPELRLQRVEALYADHPYREVALADLPTESQPSTLVRVDGDGASVVDSYAFPTGRVGLSPTFVPRDGSTTEGWVVVVVFSDDTGTPSSSGDEVWVFDAQALAQGPLARLGHPDMDLPFSLHSAWTPEAAKRTATYQVDVRADHEEEVAWTDAAVQAVFEDVVYPHFEG